MERSHSSSDFTNGPKSPKSMLGKAKTKLFHFGDHKDKNSDGENKKTIKQATFDLIFKHDKKDEQRGLKKQNTISGYPTRILIENYNDVSNEEAAGIIDDNIDANRDTAALALERPRKKLSFKEPVTSDYGNVTKMTFKEPEFSAANSLSVPKGIKRSVSLNNTLQRIPSVDDFELESQAMRVVRTIGQAFEVCHKLQISAPENDNNRDQDEQDTFAQDLTSDRLSDCTVEKTIRKDLLLESDLDKLSLSPDEGNYIHQPENKNSKGFLHRSPSFNNQYSMGMPRNFSFTQQMSDSSPTESKAPFVTSGNPGQDVQVLREQVDKQSQQIQTLMTQLQVLNEQLATEQSVRMESQARVQQLLVHNRELLDHIAALVMHLQENDQCQPNSPHATLPQLSPTAKVERWFELLEPPTSISRPESGFVSSQDADGDEDDEEAILEGTRNLIRRLSARKQKKLSRLKLGRVTTF